MVYLRQKEHYDSNWQVTFMSRITRDPLTGNTLVPEDFFILLAIN